MRADTDSLQTLINSGKYPRTVLFNDRPKYNQEILRGLKRGTLILPSEFITALPRATSFIDFRQETGRPNYDVGLYTTLRKYMDSVSNIRKIKKKQERRERFMPCVPKAILMNGGYNDGHNRITSYPKHRVRIWEFANRYLGLEKEHYEKNPCQEGIDSVMSVVRDNKTRVAEYDAAVKLYDAAHDAWTTMRDVAFKDCASFAGRRKWTGWGGGKINRSTIARTCDNQLSNHYGGRYEYTGTSEFQLSKGWRYKCQFSNYKSVLAECKRRWVAKHPEPVSPRDPIQLPLPQFTCFDCSNTVNVDGSSSVEDTVLKLANTCVSKRTDNTAVTKADSGTASADSSSTASAGGSDEIQDAGDLMPDDIPDYALYGIGGLAILGAVLIASSKN